MTYQEFLENFLEEFLKIKSFAGRIKYASQYLRRIGSGSGRIVYDIDGQRVLKLAKNAKGVAQNEAEANAGRYHDAQSIVTIVYESADDSTWLISENAKKVSERRIKELTGIPSLSDLYEFLRNYAEVSRGKKKIFTQDNELEEFFWENEFAIDLGNLIANYKQHAGDMNRLSTYGEVLRDGQPTIVLTDYGLDDKANNLYYSPKKQQYQMYEMYNFADGNDDMLSDIGNVGQDQRHGMWALIPQGVGDGDEPMNEEFISYVQNRNKYPKKRLPNLPFLTDKFNECVNNIKETLNVVKDKKLFYNNLLELQDYLIGQKYYDREPLAHETYVINETDVPNVVGMSLDDKTYAKQIADAAAEKLGFNVIGSKGGGSNGFAFDIGNDKIFKITADVGEADAAMKLMRVNPVRIAVVYNLYKIVDTEKNMSFFAIIEQNIEDKPVEKFIRFGNIIDTILPNNMPIIDFFIMMRKKFNYDNLTKLAEAILTENPEANISEIERKEAYEYLIGLFEIKKELLSYDIKSNDYSNIKNLGYDKGLLKFFDFGGYRSEEPKLRDSELIYLPEDATSKFSTVDSVGSDGFPVYDNNDTSPMTDNNIPTSIDDIVERVLSSVKGSSTVNVKKKCRLGGQGNTSAACNQGDINNLDIKSITLY